MLKYSHFLFALLCIPLHLFALASNVETEREAFTVATYNVHTDRKQENAQQNREFYRTSTKGLQALLKSRPDAVFLQKVPMKGIQWLDKYYSGDYSLIYAAQHFPGSAQKENDYLVTLYKRARFKPLVKKNRNPAIKTRYFDDNTGNLFLTVSVVDRETSRPVAFVNTRLKGGLFQKQGDREIDEIVELMQQYSYAVVAGDFNGASMKKLAEHGFVADPVAEATTSNSRKVDHVLYKGSGRSSFLEEDCRVRRDIDSSDHYPLICRMILR